MAAVSLLQMSLSKFLRTRLIVPMRRKADYQADVELKGLGDLYSYVSLGLSEQKLLQRCHERRFSGHQCFQSVAATFWKSRANIRHPRTRQSFLTCNRRGDSRGVRATSPQIH